MSFRTKKDVEDHIFDKDDVCKEFYKLVDGLTIIDYDLNEILEGYKRYINRETIESIFFKDINLSLYTINIDDIEDNNDDIKYLIAIQLLYDELDRCMQFIKRSRNANAVKLFSITDMNEKSTYGQLCIKVEILKIIE